MFYLKKRRLRRVMATVFKRVTGECSMIHVHCGHGTRKKQIRHKGILSIKVSEHWHCPVNTPVSVIYRDRCGTHCSENTQTRGDPVWGQMDGADELFWCLTCLLLQCSWKKNPNNSQKPTGKHLVFSIFQGSAATHVMQSPSTTTAGDSSESYL